MIAVDAAIVGIVLFAIGSALYVRLQRERAPGGSTIYRLTRRMAHELEGVLIQDSNFPFLANTQRASIEAVLKEWEKQL